MTPRDLARLATALLRRPDLWTAAGGVACRFRPAQWWRHPLPSREYLEYRVNAVYGLPLSAVPADDFIRYLEWCKAFPGPIR